MARSRQQLIWDVGTAVQVFQRSTDAFDDAVAAHLGLNRTDLRCLDWLSGGPMLVGQLAQATGLSSAATTKLVDRLEQKGFVRRVRSRTDRRSVLVEMTPEAARRSGEVYGPLVEDGTKLLRRYDEAELRPATRPVHHFGGLDRPTSSPGPGVVRSRQYVRS